MRTMLFYGYLTVTHFPLDQQAIPVYCFMQIKI